MKKILVLTDFTDNASNAAASAVTLSGKLHANLILYNTYLGQPIVPQYAGGPWVPEQLMWEEESNEKLALQKNELETLIARLPPQERPPSIACQRGEGNLGGNVEAFCERHDIEMVVMGARSGSTLEHLLTGSDTISVINHTSRPVLIVPAGKTLKQLKKVTFATDFDATDLKAVHYLVKLGRIFNFKLEIVHVSLWGHDDDRMDEKENAFAKQVARFKYNDNNITFQRIRGKDLINRLSHLCEESGSDLLALVHDQQGFFNRLFKESAATTILKQQHIPVLVIPELMEL